MNRRYKYFSLDEFDSPDEEGSGGMMEHEFIEQLDVARDIAGFPFIINSGFRTIAHNKAVNGTSKSSHLLGWAADIHVGSSRKRFIMIEALLDAGFTRIGVGDSFIHVDSDPEKQQNLIWTY
tara:strand:+ start:1477 stop:1842 length:366 start_codon:yes stop_codon:yes gene_type:complete